MFRKTIVAIAATAAIAVASLPTSASAHRFGSHWGVGLGIGLGVGIAASTLYANTCRTIWETRYSVRRGVYYQVPMTYC